MSAGRLTGRFPTRSLFVLAAALFVAVAANAFLRGNAATTTSPRPAPEAAGVGSVETAVFALG